MKDLTKTHSKQSVGKDGVKRVVIKPTKIERRKNASGGCDIIVTIPRLNLKAKKT